MEGIKKKIKVLFLAALLTSMCIVITFCANPGQKMIINDNKVSNIKVGDNLPDVDVGNLGLGELYTVYSSDIDVDSTDTDLAKDYKCRAVEYYSSADQNKELHVSHYDNEKHLDLETFTEAKSYNPAIGYNNYRMGLSEVYAMSNQNIEDGYYVKTVKDKSGSKYYICQQSTFKDGDNFTILSYLYICTGHNISGTNVNVGIPIIAESTIEDGFYGPSSKTFTYDEKTELPTISYYTSSKSIDQLLENYNSSYNATTEKNVHNGTEYGMAKEENALIKGVNSRLISVFIKTSDSRTAVVEIMEPVNKKTYAMEAVVEGIYLS